MANTQNKGWEQAKDTGSHAMEKGKEAATGTMEKVRDTASNIAEKARDMGGAALNKAGEAASWAGHKADDAVTAAGSGMRNLGETIRDKGPQGGILGGATSAIGGGMEQAGEYLERGFSGMGEDVAGLIKRNPVVSVLIGVGLGFVLARLTSSRS